MRTARRRRDDPRATRPPPLRGHRPRHDLAACVRTGAARAEPRAAQRGAARVAARGARAAQLRRARAVEIDPRGGELVPDALVYWSPGEGSGDSLAPDSVFLGSLPADAVRRFVAPGSGAGRVVVYSLAWQRVVRSLPVAAVTPR